MISTNANKHILYHHSEELGGYFPATYTRCDECGKVFQVKKGFVLLDGFLTCYKHFDINEFI